jgi:hypothetical protein
VTDRPPSDTETMKLGLLLETAQNQQALADDSLKRLQAHTDGLDAVVRDEVRRAVIAELTDLVEHCNGAAHALKALNRAAQLRTVWCSAILGALPGCLIASFVWWWSPTPSQIAALRSQQQQLSANIARLDQSGGRADLRSCGNPARLCVKVDKRAPAFGQQADYLVVQGY